MNRFISTTVYATFLITGSLLCSCGTNNSDTRHRKDSTGHTTNESMQDTFIRGDTDPRAQGIEGVNRNDSLRVKVPVEKDSAGVK